MSEVIPAEAVEAAAKGLAVHKWPTAIGVWESFGQGMKDDFRDQARVALEAAAPHMLAEAWQEGYMCSYDQERGGRGEGAIPVPEYLADDLAQWNPYRKESSHD